MNKRNECLLYDYFDLNLNVNKLFRNYFSGSEAPEYKKFPCDPLETRLHKIESNKERL